MSLPIDAKAQLEESQSNLAPIDQMDRGGIEEYEEPDAIRGDDQLRNGVIDDEARQENEHLGVSPPLTGEQVTEPGVPGPLAPDLTEPAPEASPDSAPPVSGSDPTTDPRVLTE